MSTLDEVRAILTEVLQLGAGGSAVLTAESRLLGGLPAFDSMAVVSVIAAIEERFGFTVRDDEIEAATFETVGSLVRFIDARRA